MGDSVRASAASRHLDPVLFKGTALVVALASPTIVLADELSLESVSANGQVKEVIKSVLKNVKTAPGATPGSVDFSVPGLVHGTVRMPQKEAAANRPTKEVVDLAPGIGDATVPATNKDLATGGALPADSPSLDIHFDGDGEAAGLPKDAVPNALDWLMPGKAKRPGRKLPPGFKGLEPSVNNMPAIMP
jgi:hypothetical protein